MSKEDKTVEKNVATRRDDERVEAALRRLQAQDLSDVDRALVQRMGWYTTREILDALGAQGPMGLRNALHHCGKRGHPGFIDDDVRRALRRLEAQGVVVSRKGTGRFPTHKGNRLWWRIIPPKPEEERLAVIHDWVQSKTGLMPHQYLVDANGGIYIPPDAVFPRQQ